MLPGKAKIVKCPYCGEEKELMTLISGNTFGAKYWSDNKRIAPMLPTISPVQKCSKCGKYFFENKQRYKEGSKCSFERGELTFPEWKEAYSQFLLEKVCKEDLLTIYYELIHSYNDYYYRNSWSTKPTEDDYRFFVSIVLAFIDNKEWSANEVLFKAELFREAGMMKECGDVLNNIHYEELEDYVKKIYSDIKQRMENNDNKVFKL